MVALFVSGDADESFFISHHFDFLVHFKAKHPFSIHFSEFLRGKRKFSSIFVFRPRESGHQHLHRSPVAGFKGLLGNGAVLLPNSELICLKRFHSRRRLLQDIPQGRFGCRNRLFSSFCLLLCALNTLGS